LINFENQEVSDDYDTTNVGANVITLEMRRKYCKEGLDIMNKIDNSSFSNYGNEKDILKQKEEFKNILKKTLIQLDIKNTLMAMLVNFTNMKNKDSNQINQMALLEDKVRRLDTKVFTTSELFNNFAKQYKLFDIIYDIFDYVFDYQSENVCNFCS